MKNNKLIVILGPTATGKTRLATGLAARFGGEVVSADSRQVYRGMDIGTGKDLQDYMVAGKATQKPSGRGAKGPRKPQQVPYHLIDIIHPNTEFNVVKYQKAAYKAIGAIQKRGKIPFLVGGTGLYIDAVTKGFVFSQVKSKKEKVKRLRGKLDKFSLPQLLLRLKKIDPTTYQIIDRKNRRRVQRALEIYYETGRPKSEQLPAAAPPYDILILGLNLPLQDIYRRIDRRLQERLASGMILEAWRLRQQGVSWRRLESFGLEYRWLARYLQGSITHAQLVEGLKNDIHHFAKRQLTWFKRNKDIIWLDSPAQAQKQVTKFLK